MNLRPWLIALIQLLLALSWVVYAVYLPRLAEQAGIPKPWVVWILAVDQAIFAVCDWASGIASDRVMNAMRRLTPFAVVAALISCASFAALPFASSAGAMLAFALAIVVWSITTAALRAPVLTLLAGFGPLSARRWVAACMVVGLALAGALAPFLARALRDWEPRAPFLFTSIALVIAVIGLLKAEPESSVGSAPKREHALAHDSIAAVTPARIALGLGLLALGMQLHTSINTSGHYLRFVSASELDKWQSVFWLAAGSGAFVAGRFKMRGTAGVLAWAPWIGTLAFAGVLMAANLSVLVAMQAMAGAAWGMLLAAAFGIAASTGVPGRGRVAGIVFSVLALGTLARIAFVGSGFAAHALIAPWLVWTPPLLWLIGSSLLWRIEKAVPSEL